MTPIDHPVSPPSSAMARPGPYALLRVGGPDAVAFLDSQLTRNVPPSGTASPVGYCSAKGRLLASAVAWRDDAFVGLLLSPSIAEPIAKRLRMYVLRSKVTIEHVVEGAVVEGRAASPATLALPVWGIDVAGGVTRIRFPDADGRQRYLAIGPSLDHAPDRIDEATWRWMNIRAGLPSVGSATQDRFVPQMLNLEALGGVDFRKGCFPGQEVVARSQYLGKLKRRTALATVDGDVVPEPGSDVRAGSGPDPVGLVVDAARGPDGRIAALIELPVASFEATDLLVADAPLRLEPLPYVLPDNDVFVRPKL